MEPPVTPVEAYRKQFGSAALPHTFGLPPETVDSLFLRAVAEGKPLTRERMAALGYPAPPPEVDA